MKKIVLALTVAILGTVVMSAQPPRRQNMDPAQMVEKRVERLDKQLSLTAEQKAQITRIYTEEMETMHKDKPAMEPKQGEKPDMEAMKAQHEKMKAQHDATNAKIEALLTPEQAAKFAEMKDEPAWRGHHGKHHKGPRGGADKAPRHNGGCNNCTCKDK